MAALLFLAILFTRGFLLSVWKFFFLNFFVTPAIDTVRPELRLWRDATFWAQKIAEPGKKKIKQIKRNLYHFGRPFSASFPQTETCNSRCESTAAVYIRVPLESSPHCIDAPFPFSSWAQNSVASLFFFVILSCVCMFLGESESLRQR